MASRQGLPAYCFVVGLRLVPPALRCGSASLLCAQLLAGTAAAARTLELSCPWLLVLCREAFDLFDTDGSGTIDAKELKGEW